MTTTTLAAPAAASRPAAIWRRLVEVRELTLLLLVVLLIAGMSLTSPYFLTMANFRAVAVGMAPTAIVAIGMTVLLVSGGFDLSVGSNLALCGTVAALLMAKGAGIPLAVAGAMALGALIGLANGVIVTRLGVNPLVATLGTMSMARGAALVMTEGFSIGGLPPAYGWVGSARWLGVPLAFWIMLALVLVADLALRHSLFLRQVYYVGGNEKAARLSGIPVDRVRTVAFVLTGLLAAFAGVLLASRLMSGTPTAANAMELQVLAACVIGGASLRGGEGTVLGAFLGVVFVALVNDAMTMLRVSIYWQMIVTGAVLVAAVVLDRLARKSR
jgi:ribose transport system permease protein